MISQIIMILCDTSDTNDINVSCRDDRQPRIHG